MVKPILELEEDYYRASNALVEYRWVLGFEPGVRVLACHRGEESPGVIAPYGEEWRVCAPYHVLVRLDKGYLQPWAMSDLKILG